MYRFMLYWTLFAPPWEVMGSRETAVEDALQNKWNARAISLRDEQHAFLNKTVQTYEEKREFFAVLKFFRNDLDTWTSNRFSQRSTDYGS
jgi:hypothetical protein